MVAMWYGFLNAHIAVETYPKSQKVVNLRCDPRVTVLVETGDSYDGLRGVQIAGTAVIHDDVETVAKVCRSVIERYNGNLDSGQLNTTAHQLAQKRIAVEIVPEQVISWDHTKL